MSSPQKSGKELQESPNEKLKNYLTPIVTYADLLSQKISGKLSDPQKEKIELIKEQTNKITNYLETIKNEAIFLIDKIDSDSERVEKSHIEYDIDMFSREIIKIRKKSKNILVIYNNRSLCKIFEDFLKHEGHDCICAVDGRNGLSLIETEKFDLVLLGLTLPEFSGYDIISVLEEDGKLRKSNIIILSASHLPQSEIENLLKRGVCSYLQQPVKPDVLLRILETA